MAHLQGRHEEAVKHYAKAIAGYSASKKRGSKLEMQAELHAGCGDSLTELGEQEKQWIGLVMLSDCWVHNLSVAVNKPV